MALHLKIENVPNLPDGGPVEITVTGKRGIDIGRDSHLDWTLPDPTRHISSKHAEIRYKEGGYWLHDVSTNGTFLNGSDHRMQTPRRLRSGDRFTIGHYIIAAAVDEEQEPAVPDADAGARPAAGQQDLWSIPGDAPPPIDPRELRAARDSSPVRPDFLDWAADVPHPFDDAVSPVPPPGQPPRLDATSDLGGDMDWARGAPIPAPEPPPPPPMPSPRRPATFGGEAAPASEQPLPPLPQDAPGVAAVPPPARQAAAPPPRLSSPAGIDDFVRALARGAGVPEQVFAGKDNQELAEQLGAMLRVVVENLSQLLNARVHAKRMVRSASHTVIQATDNNPLKFSPSAEEALRIMFGPPTRSYLDAHQALLRGFEDIKTHQIKTYSAMQHALTKLLADLDPQTIDQAVEVDRGISALVASRKAKLWDAYVARWQAKQRSESGGLVDAFMLIFAQYYDEQRS